MSLPAPKPTQDVKAPEAPVDCCPKYGRPSEPQGGVYSETKCPMCGKTVYTVIKACF